MLHHIQKGIIDVLAGIDPAKYSDLKPTSMDGNQFTYHLKQLLVEKFVQKNEDSTYSLTQKGRSYLVTRFENPDEMAHTIFLVVIRHSNKLLLRERKIQPLLGYVGFVHGEPVAGQSLGDAVYERIHAKTGISLDAYTVHGGGLIRMIKDGQTQSFSHAIIVECSFDSEDIPILEDQTGKNYWLHEDELSSLNKLIPSTNAILDYAANSNQRWFDLSYEIK